LAEGKKGTWVSYKLEKDGGNLVEHTSNGKEKVDDAEEGRSFPNGFAIVPNIKK
jgi:hypothetical protein